MFDLRFWPISIIKYCTMYLFTLAVTKHKYTCISFCNYVTGHLLPEVPTNIRRFIIIGPNKHLSCLVLIGLFLSLCSVQCIYLRWLLLSTCFSAFVILSLDIYPDWYIIRSPKSQYKFDLSCFVWPISIFMYLFTL